MRKGQHPSLETRKKMSEKAKLRVGSKAAHWKGGIMLVDGYKYIYNPIHPNATKIGYVCEHRLMMEHKLGRLLNSKEVVHHKDGNKLNNSIENLELFSSRGTHSFNEHCMKDKLGRFSKLDNE